MFRKFQILTDCQCTSMLYLLTSLQRSKEILGNRSGQQRVRGSEQFLALTNLSPLS